MRTGINDGPLPLWRDGGGKWSSVQAPWSRGRESLSRVQDRSECLCNLETAEGRACYDSLTVIAKLTLSPKLPIYPPGILGEFGSTKSFSALLWMRLLMYCVYLWTDKALSR